MWARSTRALRTERLVTQWALFKLSSLKQPGYHRLGIWVLECQSWTPVSRLRDWIYIKTVCVKNCGILTPYLHASTSGVTCWPPSHFPITSPTLNLGPTREAKCTLYTSHRRCLTSSQPATSFPMATASQLSGPEWSLPLHLYHTSPTHRRGFPTPAPAFRSLLKASGGNRLPWGTGSWDTHCLHSQWPLGISSRPAFQPAHA